MLGILADPYLFWGWEFFLTICSLALIKLILIDLTFSIADKVLQSWDKLLYLIFPLLVSCSSLSSLLPLSNKLFSCFLFISSIRKLWEGLLCSKEYLWLRLVGLLFLWLFLLLLTLYSEKRTGDFSYLSFLFVIYCNIFRRSLFAPRCFRILWKFGIYEWVGTPLINLYIIITTIKEKRRDL